MSRTISTNQETGVSIAGTHVVGAPLSLPDTTGVDLSDAVGFSSIFELLNGPAGPTVGAYAQVMVKHGATWVAYGYPVQSGLTNDMSYRWPAELGHNAPSAIRLDVYGNTGQNVSATWDWTRTDAVA